MGTTQLSREEALSLVGGDVSSLEFMRRDENEKIRLLSDAELSFAGMISGREVYYLSGTENQVKTAFDPISQN